jgi:hypothetical protein
MSTLATLCPRVKPVVRIYREPADEFEAARLPSQVPGGILSGIAPTTFLVSDEPGGPGPMNSRSLRNKGERAR